MRPVRAIVPKTRWQTIVMALGSLMDLSGSVWFEECDEQPFHRDYVNLKGDWGWAVEDARNQLSAQQLSLFSTDDGKRPERETAA